MTTGVSFLPESRNEDLGLSFEFNKTFDSGVTLTSISALRSFDSYDFVDIDFTNLPVLDRTNDATQDSFSQEFRLAGEWGNGHNYLFGAYYFEQEIVNKKTTNDAGLLSAFLGTDPRLGSGRGNCRSGRFDSRLGRPGLPAVSPNFGAAGLDRTR